MEAGGSRRLEAVVSGIVQGVGYRAFVLSRARALGVSGTVCNLPDGCVKVTAEGAADRLASLLEELHQGPWGARVEDVEVSWSEATGAYPAFGVAYAGWRSPEGGPSRRT
jgi:acylphosphatase